MIDLPGKAYRAVVVALLAATVLSACTAAPGATGGGGAAKPSGKPEVAAISVGTCRPQRPAGLVGSL